MTAFMREQVALVITSLALVSCAGFFTHPVCLGPLRGGAAANPVGSLIYSERWSCSCVTAVEELREKNGVLEGNVQGLTEKNQVLEGTVKNLEENVQGLTEKIQELEGTVQGLTEKNQELEGTVKNQEENVQGLTGKIQELEGTVQGLTEKIQVLEGTVKNLEGNVQGLKNSVDEAMKEIAKHAILINRITEDIALEKRSDFIKGTLSLAQNILFFLTKTFGPEEQAKDLDGWFEKNNTRMFNLGRVLNVPVSSELKSEILRLYHYRPKQPMCGSLTELYEKVQNFRLDDFAHFDSNPHAYGAEVVLSFRLIEKAKSLDEVFHFPVSIRYAITILHP
jgi:TolA-binding protein